MFELRELIQCCSGRLSGPPDDPVLRLKGIGIDSRLPLTGQAFLCIQGDRFDGHDFVEQAVANGAALLIVQEDRMAQGGFLPKKCPCLIVKDSIKALADIAAFHRRRFGIPVIAVTGSNGKTTTKEMIAHILSAKMRVLKSRASFNNQIGVPLTLLKLESDHQAAVLELGMNHAGELTRLAGFSRPTAGVITNAGSAHLEFFSGTEEIIAAKCELIAALALGSLAIINADQEDLWDMAGSFSVTRQGFGLENDCEWRGELLAEGNGRAWFRVKGVECRPEFPGVHNVYNCLAALAVCVEQFGIDLREACASLEEFSLPDLRMQVREARGIRMIADCYNANPASMRAAIQTLSRMTVTGRKILVAADMLELGRFSRRAHEETGRTAAEAVDVLVALGGMAGFTCAAALRAGMDKAAIFACQDQADAERLLFGMLREGDTVLFKGSRGTRLEELVGKLTDNGKTARDG